MSTLRRLAKSLPWLLVLLVVTGCGAGGTTSTGRGTLVVSAASSLKAAFTQYGDAFDGARVRLSLAGSDLLAAQLRQGVRPDVFAAANTTLPQALFSEGLVGRPTVFAGNRLVLAVPSSPGGRVQSLRDLARADTTIGAGSESVPVGAYTRKVLSRLGDRQERAILANIRSSEPDVAGVVGKLTQGAVDAGFVYITDVKATNGRLRAIELPKALKPQVAYAVAIVRDAPHTETAERFVAGLLRGKGREALLRAGFTAPPGR